MKGTPNGLLSSGCFLHRGCPKYTCSVWECRICLLLSVAVGYRLWMSPHMQEASIASIASIIHCLHCPTSSAYCSQKVKPSKPPNIATRPSEELSGRCACEIVIKDLNLWFETWVENLHTKTYQDIQQSSQPSALLNSRAGTKCPLCSKGSDLGHARRYLIGANKIRKFEKNATHLMHWLSDYCINHRLFIVD